MADAAEELEAETTFADEAEEAWAEVEAAQVGHDSAEVPAETPAEAQTTQEDPAQPPGDLEAAAVPGEGADTPEPPLEPLHHWPEAYKGLFKELTPANQKLYMERERKFEDAYRSKSTEAAQASRALDDFRKIIAPHLQGWQRQGLTPSQGVTRWAALEKDLQEKPAETLIGLAKQMGVDLGEAIAEQPYVHPAVAGLQDELRQVRETLAQREEHDRQAAQRQRQSQSEAALHQIEAFASETNPDGSKKYPLVEDRLVMQTMSQLLTAGQVRDLPAAYEGAIAHLKQHPLYQETQAQQVQTAQADVTRAEKASRTVQPSAEAAPAGGIDDDDAAILRQLEAAGLE